MTQIVIGSSPLTLSQLRAVVDAPASISLSDRAWAAVDAGAAAVAAIIETGQTVYGVNTGFGLLANTSIAREDLETLQTNLVLSHACGVGEPLPDPIVRLMLVLKIASLSKGASAIRGETLQALIALVEHDAATAAAILSVDSPRWRMASMCARIDGRDSMSNGLMAAL